MLHPRVVTGLVPPSKLMIWVPSAGGTSPSTVKQRVLGFQDPDLTEVPRDSPTLSAASEALIMQWVASHKYRLISGDIKTAFLREMRISETFSFHHQTT